MEFKDQMNATIPIAQIIQWVEAQREFFNRHGINLVGTFEHPLHAPSMHADFDGHGAIGRISMWSTGEVDFEVVESSNGAFRFFKHEDVSELESDELKQALLQFVRALEKVD